MPPDAAAHGRLPEWPKGAVCKTVGSAYVGSNPTPATPWKRLASCEDAGRRGGPCCRDVYQDVSLRVDAWQYFSWIRRYRCQDLMSAAGFYLHSADHCRID